MATQLKVNGFTELGQAFDYLGAEWPNAAEQIALEVTELMELTAKGEVKKKNLLFGRFLFNSIRSSVWAEGSDASVKIKGSTFSDLVYAPVMEFGRRAGARQPPVDALLSWVTQKLGVPSGKARGVAFVIARSIARKGIKGRGFMKRAAAVAERSLGKIADRVIGEFLERA